MVNDTPATSRKYQFAMAMADQIVDENTRDGNIELLEINRYALASAFARTSALLRRSFRAVTNQPAINSVHGAHASSAHSHLATLLLHLWSKVLVQSSPLRVALVRRRNDRWFWEGGREWMMWRQRSMHKNFCGLWIR